MYLRTNTDMLAGPRLQALCVETGRSDRVTRDCARQLGSGLVRRNVRLRARVESVAVAVAQDPADRVPRLMGQHDGPALVGGLGE
jgi:hypothetical protein